MGVATGGAHPAVKDSLSRPITAGGFVDGATVVFSDITKQAGLEKFLHRSGTPEKKTILETIGSGVALIDYDNDGWLDIYLLNGSTIAALKGKEAAPRAMLFHNNHDGTFTDVTEKAGVANERWGFGVAVGDYDNDGWPDIYVANFGKNRLYHNNHDGTFTDVAEKAGVAAGRLVRGAYLGRLRPRWPAGFVCSGLREIRYRQSTDRRTRADPAEFLPVPGNCRDVRAARIAGRERPPVS